MSNFLNYIDLFSGCGGLSLGLLNSGHWKGKFAIEKNPDAFATFKFNLIDKKNHFDWPDWLPQTNHCINNLLEQYSEQLYSLRDQIDLVAGGPPCQGFSTAGRRNEDDLRNKLINSYIEFIRLVQPKILFFENVKGFTQQFKSNKNTGRIYSNYVKSELGKSSQEENYFGYKVSGQLIDFSLYGVPQKRTRFILVGIRSDISEELDPSTFFKSIEHNKTQFLINKGIGLTNSLEDAISDLLIPTGQSFSGCPSINMGTYRNIQTDYQKMLKGDLQDNYPDSHRFAKHSTSTIAKFKYILANSPRNKSLSKDVKEKFSIKKRTIIPLCGKLPAPTITTLPDDYIHYCEPRILTVREYARIQSFNDWFEFKGKYTTGGKLRKFEVPRYSQIGNAIPPLFAEQAALSLKSLL